MQQASQVQPVVSHPQSTDLGSGLEGGIALTNHDCQLAEVALSSGEVRRAQPAILDRSKIGTGHRSATGTRTVAVVPHASRTFADTLQRQRRSHGTLGQTRDGTVLRGGEASVPSYRSLAVQVRVIERRRASHPPDERADPCSREVQLRSREGVPANRPLHRTELVNQHLVRAPGGWAGREASPPDRGDYAPLFCRRPL